MWEIGRKKKNKEEVDDSYFHNQPSHSPASLNVVDEEMMAWLLLNKEILDYVEAVMKKKVVGENKSNRI